MSTVTHPPGGLGTRMRARLLPGALDRELAAGADPSASAAMSLRAERLVSARFRASLADGLERVIEAAAEPPEAFSARAPLRREAVLVASPELGALAERLRAPEPVDPRGVALAERLLADGTGPLYTSGSIALAAWEAAWAL